MTVTSGPNRVRPAVNEYPGRPREARRTGARSGARQSSNRTSPPRRLNNPGCGG